MDGKGTSEDEEDNDKRFVVEEAVPPPSDDPAIDAVSNLHSDSFKDL